MKYLFSFLFLLTLFACGNDTATTEEAQATPPEYATQQKAYDEMMTGHDRVMEQMGLITRSQKGLRAAMDAEDLTAERKVMMMKTDSLLENTHDGMMLWMREVKTLDELRTEMDNDQKIMEYIAAEKREMDMIEKDLKSGVDQAEQLLRDNN